MKTLQAFRFALDPNDAQRAGLSRHAGAARFVFNWGLARVKAGVSQREAERSYGILEADLTPVPWTLAALRLEWNRAKGEVAPWWSECSKEALRHENGWSYPRLSREELEGRFLGLMANLGPKGAGGQ